MSEKSKEKIDEIKCLIRELLLNERVKRIILIIEFNANTASANCKKCKN